MSWFGGKKLLVPIDFGEQSQAAVDEALQMARSPADVCVVHVAPNLTISSPEVVWEAIDDETRRENIENLFRKRFAAGNYRGISFQVLFGDPGHKIADYAQRIDADLIVMPSHGRTGLQRLLIGSVAERVLRLSPCPVLVLRE